MADVPPEDDGALEYGTEAERVAAWRLHVLVNVAGYPVPLAELIAASDADLHRAVDLLAQGCGFELAAEILL